MSYLCVHTGVVQTQKHTFLPHACSRQDIVVPFSAKAAEASGKHFAPFRNFNFQHMDRFDRYAGSREARGNFQEFQKSKNFSLSCENLATSKHVCRHDIFSSEPGKRWKIGRVTSREGSVAGDTREATPLKNSVQADESEKYS